MGAYFYDEYGARTWWVVTTICLGVAVFIVGNIGIADAIYLPHRCQEPLRRIEYVFPAYRVGCWLGSVP